MSMPWHVVHYVCFPGVRFIKPSILQHRRGETVVCMSEGCSFKTNIYGTFNSHMNRKHKPHLKILKTGIVGTTPVLHISENPDEDADNQHHSTVEVERACSSSDLNVTNNLS